MNIAVEKTAIEKIMALYGEAVNASDISKSLGNCSRLKKGDDAFNARDFAGMKAVHHPDMIAHITGNAQPVCGQEAHASLIKEMFRMFPDVHVYNDPYPIQFGSGDWISP